MSKFIQIFLDEYFLINSSVKLGLLLFYKVRHIRKHVSHSWLIDLIWTLNSQLTDLFIWNSFDAQLLFVTHSLCFFSDHMHFLVGRVRRRYALSVSKYAYCLFAKYLTDSIAVCVLYYYFWKFPIPCCLFLQRNSKGV